MIYIVTLEECSENECEYFGWKYKNEHKISFIFKNQKLLSTCFTYGIDTEIENGTGNIVYLKITECKPCCAAKDIKNFPHNNI